MQPLCYGNMTWIVQKLFDSDCKRVGQKDPPPGVKCSKCTSDPIGLSVFCGNLKTKCISFVYKLDLKLENIIFAIEMPMQDCVFLLSKKN